MRLIWCPLSNIPGFSHPAAAPQGWLLAVISHSDDRLWTYSCVGLKGSSPSSLPKLAWWLAEFREFSRSVPLTNGPARTSWRHLVNCYYCRFGARCTLVEFAFVWEVGKSFSAQLDGSFSAVSLMISIPVDRTYSRRLLLQYQARRSSAASKTCAVDFKRRQLQGFHAMAKNKSERIFATFINILRELTTLMSYLDAMTPEAANNQYRVRAFSVGTEVQAVCSPSITRLFFDSPARAMLLLCPLRSLKQLFASPIYSALAELSLSVVEYGQAAQAEHLDIILPRHMSRTPASVTKLR